ncbi:HAD family hydrolase [Roseivirga sp. BDSF3-8]|uniref:HAD family hydrolase n=1 Tax=Roseivirga sp. BDSF3-8 TaxID=3241598 RepID=UPI003531C946
MTQTKSDILLILDLDETLIHATAARLATDPDGHLAGYHIYKRPGLDTFLQYSLSHYRVAIWSSASDDYVYNIVEWLGIGECLEFIWGRSRTTTRVISATDDYGQYDQDRPSHYGYVKPLKKVRRRGYDLNRVLIVDDTPAKVRGNYGNAIYVTEFKGSPDDTELKELATYLDTLKFADNVRHIEKRNWKRRIV